MNINSRPLSLNMLANVDKFAGRIGCLEERSPWLPGLPRLPRKMPLGGGFEGDYLGCLGCLEEMPSGSGFEGDYFGRRVASK